MRVSQGYLRWNSPGSAKCKCKGLEVEAKLVCVRRQVGLERNEKARMVTGEVREDKERQSKYRACRSF